MQEMALIERKVLGPRMASNETHQYVLEPLLHSACAPYLRITPTALWYPTQLISHVGRLRPLKVHSQQALVMVNAPSAVVIRHAGQRC